MNTSTTAGRIAKLARYRRPTVTVVTPLEVLHDLKRLAPSWSYTHTLMAFRAMFSIAFTLSVLRSLLEERDR